METDPDTANMPIPGIELSEADAKIQLLSQPIADRAPVDAGQLRALLIERGYGECALDEPAIENAARMCNSQTEPLGVQVGQRLDAVLVMGQVDHALVVGDF